MSELIKLHVRFFSPLVWLYFEMQMKYQLLKVSNERIFRY